MGKEINVNCDEKQTQSFTIIGQIIRVYSVMYKMEYPNSEAFALCLSFQPATFGSARQT